MKKLLCVAAISSGLLSACASVETSTNGAAAQTAPPDAMYCWQDQLHTSGNDLVCNWAASAGKACNETRQSNISKDSIATGPTNVKRCDNGQWVVQVTRK